MRFTFHPDAETEFDQAVAYYEHRQSGLGIELADEVLATIARILDHPRAGSPFSKNTRRCLTNRFPFSDLSQTKLRPAVVLADAGRDDRILCQVTSKPYGHTQVIKLEDTDFSAGSLRVLSYAGPDKLFTAKR